LLTLLYTAIPPSDTPSPPRRSSDLRLRRLRASSMQAAAPATPSAAGSGTIVAAVSAPLPLTPYSSVRSPCTADKLIPAGRTRPRSEEHTSELQSRENLVCRLLLEKK